MIEGCIIDLYPQLMTKLMTKYDIDDRKLHPSITYEFNDDHSVKFQDIQKVMTCAINKAKESEQ